MFGQRKSLAQKYSFSFVTETIRPKLNVVIMQARGNGLRNWMKMLPWEREMRPRAKFLRRASGHWSGRKRLPVYKRITRKERKSSHLDDFHISCKAWCPIGIWCSMQSFYLLIHITLTNVTCNVNAMGPENDTQCAQITKFTWHSVCRSEYDPSWWSWQ